MSEQAETTGPSPKTMRATIDKVHAEPFLVLEDGRLFERYYAALKADAAAVGTAIDTKAARERIASCAFRLGSAAATIDKARLAKTKEWRDRTAQVNAMGKIVDGKLRALQATVRQPLTQWEQAEESREQGCKDRVEQMQRMTIVTMEDTAETVRGRLEAVRGINDIDREVYRDMFELASATHDRAIDTLTAALAQIEQREKEAAELRELREARAREDRVKELAVEEERQRQMKAEEEQRLAKAREQAAEQARADEAAAAQRRLDAQEAAHKAELARIEQKRIDEDAEAARVKAVADAEEQRRQANRSHRSKINRAIVGKLQALSNDTLTEGAAKLIMEAMVRGEIPNVSVQY